MQFYFWVGKLEGEKMPEKKMGSKVQRGNRWSQGPGILHYPTAIWNTALVQKPLGPQSSSPVLTDGFAKMNMLGQDLRKAEVNSNQHGGIMEIHLTFLIREWQQWPWTKHAQFVYVLSTNASVYQNGRVSPRAGIWAKMYKVCPINWISIKN